MAQLYEGADMRANAARLMKFAVERAPQDLETRLAAARWAYQAGLAVEAKTHCDAALKINPGSTTAKKYLGILSRGERNFVKAEQIFEALHLQAPSDFQSSNQLALSLIAQDDPSKQRRALNYAEVNAKAHTNGRQPVAREAAATLGWVKFRLGQQEDAEKQIAAAMRAGPISPEAAYYAARIFSAGRKTDDALKILKATLKNKANFVHRDDAEKLMASLQAPVGDEKDLFPDPAGE